MEENNFDVVVLGTGLIESILAGALSRVGKTVLHLDSNHYYGGRWTAMTLVDFIEHYQNILVKKIDSKEGTIDGEESSDSINFYNNYVSTFEDVEVQLYHSAIESTTQEEVENETSKDASDLMLELSDLISSKAKCSAIAQKIENYAKFTLGLNTRELEDAVRVESTRQAIALKSQVVTGHELQNFVTTRVNKLKTSIIQTSVILQHSRQYNLEMSPKLLSCSDRLIDDLVASGVSRYLDFKLLEGTYMGWDGKYDKVPCSKEDIFTSKSLSLIDKRKLMKFLTYAMDTSSDPAILNEYKEQPFDKMLREKFLIKDNLLNAAIYSIALIPTTGAEVTSEFGLECTQRYLKSLGRYGNSAFLHTMYGSGSEISQGFCRLSAVYGGIYMLGHSIDKLRFDEESKLFSIECQNDNVFKAPIIISSSDYKSKHMNYAQEMKTTKVSRGVFLIDKPVFPETQLIKIVTPPLFANNPNPVFALQVTNGVQACPKNQFVVYMWSLSSNSPRGDLFEIAQSLLSFDDSETNKPKVLVSLFCQQTVTKPEMMNDVTTNIFLTSDPDHGIDFTNVVDEAHEIFKRICPGEEFLEPTPDPEIEAEYIQNE